MPICYFRTLNKHGRDRRSKKQIEQFRQPLPPLPTNQGQSIILSNYNPKKLNVEISVLAGQKTYRSHGGFTKVCPTMLGPKALSIQSIHRLWLYPTYQFVTGSLSRANLHALFTLLRKFYNFRAMWSWNRQSIWATGKKTFLGDTSLDMTWIAGFPTFDGKFSNIQ